MANLNMIPNEILVEIFNKLSTKDRINLINVGERYKEVGRTPSLWTDMELSWRESYRQTCSTNDHEQQQIHIRWSRQCPQGMQIKFLEGPQGMQIKFLEELSISIEDAVWLVTRASRARIEKWRPLSTSLAEKILSSILAESSEEREERKKILALEDLDFRY